MRYSKQRELVMQTVQNLCDHPTAEEIYDAAVKECPGLSLGTVYRNLTRLVAAGRVRRVSIPGKADRFDHTLVDHAHAYCTQCGSVADVLPEALPLLQDALREGSGFQVRQMNLVLAGICPQCQKLMQ